MPNLIKSVTGRLAVALTRYAPRRPPARETIDGLTFALSKLAASTEDCTLPDISNARWISLDKQQNTRGINVRPRGGGKENWLVLCQGAESSQRLVIDLDKGIQNNIVVVGPVARFQGRLHLQGSQGQVVLGGNINWPCEIDVRLSSKRNTLLWGRGATSNGLRAIIEGEGRSVVVGDDCMFARNTHLATSDLHGISDTRNGKWLNPPGDVNLGRHVWIGQDAMVMKGVTIGDGAIIGARSLVNRDVQSATIVAGSPAKPVKTGIVWTRERSPNPI